jgi:hypothetical protein
LHFFVGCPSSQRSCEFSLIPQVCSASLSLRCRSPRSLSKSSPKILENGVPWRDAMRCNVTSLLRGGRPIPLPSGADRQSSTAAKSWRMGCLASPSLLSHYPQVQIVDRRSWPNLGEWGAWRRRLFSPTTLRCRLSKSLLKSSPNLGEWGAWPRRLFSPTTLRCRLLIVDRRQILENGVPGVAVSSLPLPSGADCQNCCQNRRQILENGVPGVARSSQRSCEFSLIPPVWLHDVTADLSRQIKV